MTGFIECSRLSRVFRSVGGVKTTALSEVNLSIEKNEFVCLLGPSGCGKTTLLNLIAGFISPTTGQVFVNDNPVRKPGPDRGVVFQDYSLFGWLTVRENVEFGPRMTGLPREERHKLASHYLTLVGLIHAERKYPFELSGGMKQRVAIARSLVTKPQVLLMDEPFAALDAMTRDTLQSELLAIQSTEQKTIIFVTHNIAEAIYLADRIVVMSAHPGRIKEIIDISLQRPRSRATVEFNKIYEDLERAIGSHAAE